MSPAQILVAVATLVLALAAVGNAESPNSNSPQHTTTTYLRLHSTLLGSMGTPKTRVPSGAAWGFPDGAAPLLTVSKSHVFVVTANLRGFGVFTKSGLAFVQTIFPGIDATAGVGIVGNIRGLAASSDGEYLFVLSQGSRALKDADRTAHM